MISTMTAKTVVFATYLAAQAPKILLELTQVLIGCSLSSWPSRALFMVDRNVAPTFDVALQLLWMVNIYKMDTSIRTVWSIKKLECYILICYSQPLVVYNPSI
jgi:hypothetical protein